jgi:hypothetical protein
MATVGRNDACPCGSGRKYKRCCMGHEAPRAQFASELQAHGLPLLRELGRFATQRLQKPPETVAAERFPFWQPPLDRVRTSRLLEYLIFDDRAGSYGRTAASEYLAERGPLLAQEWRSLLQAWQDSTMRLFVLEQWSGGFARCRPELPESGPTIEVMPLETGAAMADGSPVALRALPVGSRFVYASWPITFGERSVDDVRQALIARHHTFVRSERIVNLSEFFALRATAFDEEAAAVRGSQIILPGHA